MLEIIQFEEVYTTKFHGPTNYKGARISVTDFEGKRIYVDYPHNKRQGVDAHRYAVREFMNKYPHDKSNYHKLVKIPRDTGYQFVLI